MVKKPRKVRTDHELREASCHVGYEFRMLKECVLRLRTDSCRGDWAVRNALLESFGFHARVILEFLYPTKPRLDDITANGFFHDPAKWDSLRPQCPPVRGEVDHRVGKEMAHLTYARKRDEEDRLWDPPQVWQQVEPVIQAFLRAVPESRLDSSVRGTASSVNHMHRNSWTVSTSRR